MSLTRGKWELVQSFIHSFIHSFHIQFIFWTLLNESTGRVQPSRWERQKSVSSQFAERWLLLGPLSLRDTVCLPFRNQINAFLPSRCHAKILPLALFSRVCFIQVPTFKNFLCACEENIEVGTCLQIATTANNKGNSLFADVSRSGVILFESQLSHKYFGHAKSQPEISIFRGVCI